MIKRQDSLLSCFYIKTVFTGFVAFRILFAELIGAEINGLDFNKMFYKLRGYG